MTKIEAFLYKLFGASWFTSLIGYLVMAGGIAELVQEALTTQGVPTNMTGWVTLIGGIGIRATKQANVTNAPHPLAVAQVVVADLGAKMADKPDAVAKP